MGILAAIAIPRLGGFREDADAKAQEANYRAVESAVQMYIAQNGAPATGSTYASVNLSSYLNDTNIKIKAPGSDTVTDFPGTVTISPDGSWVTP